MPIKSKLVNRRGLLIKASKLLAASPLLGLYSCGGDDNDDLNVIPIEVTPGPTAPTASPVSESDSLWLSGGTSAMRVDFPPAVSPFASGLGNACQITEELILGPCFFDVDNERDDISEGQLGIPMTLAMKVVKANCEAVEGAVVEVWWCNSEGIYSADDSDATGNVSNFSAGFCSGNDSEALNSRWFRGIKTTNSEGEVYFKACFPGWYPGRTTHIHFRVVLNGAEQLVSQFCFDDNLANEIYINHPDYTGVEKDTLNGRDSIFRADTVGEYLYEVERQADGSMLAYKAIQLNL